MPAAYLDSLPTGNYVEAYADPLDSSTEELAILYWSPGSLCGAAVCEEPVSGSYVLCSARDGGIS